MSGLSAKPLTSADISALLTADGVGGAIASIPQGEIGSFLFARRKTVGQPAWTGTLYPGSEIISCGVPVLKTGSSLLYGNSAGAEKTGTWMALGSCVVDSTHYAATLFMRVA